VESELVFPETNDAAWRSLTLGALHDRPIGDSLPYNGRRNDIPVDSVHDFLVTCEIVVLSGTGELTIGLRDGADDATLTLSSRTGATMSAGGLVSDGVYASLRQGTVHKLEFAFVDRRVSMSWDGVSTAAPIDLPPAENRSGVVHPLFFRVRGIGVAIRNLRLMRDLHYTAAGRLGTGQYRLGSDEYFMLGDNSSNSEDSRFWSKPGVSTNCLIGRPILMYAASRWRRWTALGRTWDVQAIDENRFGWMR
jgi:signal peptidase I